MKRKSIFVAARFVVVCLSLGTVSQNAFAVPIYNVAEDILPSGLATLQDERSTWASDFGGSLSTEGFEDLVASPSNVIDFGDFTLSYTGNSGLTLFGTNSLVRTEGDNGLGFTGDGMLTFTFDNAINAFGIDWSSFDLTSTVVGYSDNAGGAIADVFVPLTYAGAGFLGVRNDDAFNTVSFSVTQTEILEFDYIQYGSTNAVPEPSILALIGLGLAGFRVNSYRRKKQPRM